jgi:hypothetical protein
MLLTLQLAEFSFKHSKADSPTRRVGESFLDYKYLREFKAKIGTARKVDLQKPQNIRLIAMPL